MEILEDISLKPYNTFGIDVRAKYYVSVQTVEELQAVLADTKFQDRFILSGGSNMLLTSDIDALVVHINIRGIACVEETLDRVILKVAAGENWHEFVMHCLKNNYGGIENLSLIPGNCGTAPVQNIGAYGVELKDVFISCEAVNINTQDIRTFTLEDCKFAYRESIFKGELKNEFIITNITLELTKATFHNIKTKYGAIENELLKKNIQNPSILDISRAVIAIRESKLPNPKIIGNSGSFFKNPIIPIDKLNELKYHFPDLPYYIVDEHNIKIPAGWLIETSGFKGKRFGEYGVHKTQALVLVNYGNALGKEILELAKLIQYTIKRIFDIEIEMEVNVF